MKRNLFGILSLVVLSMLLSASAAYAQSLVQADVPFAFKVGKTQLPAGTYEIRTNCQHMVVIHNPQAGKSAFSQVMPGETSDASPRLVFHRIGNQYFLAEIWGLGGAAWTNLPTSRLEKELEIAAAPAASSDEVVMAHK
jgi:hypothetical protein